MSPITRDSAAAIGADRGNSSSSEENYVDVERRAAAAASDADIAEGSSRNKSSNNNNSSSSSSSSSHNHGGQALKDGAAKLLTNINEKLHVQDIQKNFTQTITELADLAIEEVDEEDLSPQVNLALRQQVVQYVTSGVKQSVKLSQGSGSDRGSSTVFGASTRARAATVLPGTQYVDPAVVDGLQVTEFLLETDQLPFKSFATDLFHEIRMNEGIDDEYYLQLLSSPANERLSEGASGAFMFFCGDNELIVKTIRAREAKVLHQSMKQYSDYLRGNQESFLCKFLGSYSLRVYSQTFYFVIMRNCFDPNADINERYDIKGSWEGRSADPSKTKKRATCRHCNTYFIPSKKEQCSVIVGVHEENVVLKDNDLRTKISLYHTEAKRILSVLKKDSDLLGELGVIDYSLLIGVKKWKFPVTVPDDELEKSKKKIKKE
jgi:1-phosphatidylinositol-4-phosphate 5-kinase